MEAAVGDRIVVAAAKLGGHMQDGEIMRVGSHGRRLPRAFPTMGARRSSSLVRMRMSAITSCRNRAGLTIAAARQESSREKLEKGYRSEFRYGNFVRQVRLPAGTSAEVVSAAYQDGVLEIRMPNPPRRQPPRRIQIQRG